MKLRLLPNWRKVLNKAISMHLILLAGLLSGLEVGMPALSQYIEPLDIIPHGAMAILAVLVSILAAMARLVAQPKSFP